MTSEELPEESVEETADSDPDSILATDLAQRISRGRAVLSKCEKEIASTLLIDGKNLRQWAEELRVNVPENIDDMKSLEESLSKVAVSTQKAEYVLAVFELQASAAENFYEAGYAQRFVHEMESRKGDGRIAEGKIRQLVLVNNSVDLALSASQTAKMVVEYFKRIVRGLEATRRTLEARVELTRLRLRYLE